MKREHKDKKGLYKQARREKELGIAINLAGGADNYLSAKKAAAERRHVMSKQRRCADSDND